MKKLLFLFFVIHGLSPYICIAKEAASPKQSNSSFIEHYVFAVQKEMDELVITLPDNERVETLGSIALMSGCTSLEKLRTEHKALLNLELSEQEGEQIRIKAYAKLIIPLVLRLNETLINQLAAIDEMLFYWRYQEEHWLYYVTHKDPTKFIAEDQFDEAQNRVRALEQIQQQKWSTLGSLLVHLSTYTPQSHPTSQEKWLKTLLEMIIMGIPKQRIPEHSAPLFVFFDKAVRSISLCSSSFNRVIAPYMIPDWYKRYWMASSAAAVAVFFAGRSLYRNREQIGNRVGEGKQLMYDAKEKIQNMLEKEREEKQKLSERKVQLVHDYEHILLKFLPFFTENENDRRALAKDSIEHKCKQLPNHELRKADYPVNDQVMRKLAQVQSFAELSIDDIKGVDHNKAYEIVYTELFNSNVELVKSWV